MTPPEETEFITVVMTGEGIEVPLSADWMSRKLTYSTPSHSASGTRTAAPPMKMVLLGADGSRWYTKLLDHLDLLLANTHATGPSLIIEISQEDYRRYKLHRPCYDCEFEKYEDPSYSLFCTLFRLR